MSELSLPFIYDQFRASTVRADVFPVGFSPLDVLGDETPESMNRLFTALDSAMKQL